MHIEDLKRWHWLVISVVVGLLLSMVYSSSASEGGLLDGRTIAPQDFLWRLGQTTKDAKGNQLPIFRNVKVYPPVETKQVVNVEELVITVDRATGKRSGEYQPRQLVAEIPFVLNKRFPPKDPNHTILKELETRRGRNAKIDFTYVTWAAKPWVYTICTGGSVLLLGIVWPTVLGYLQGAGLGPAPKAKVDDKWDLSKAPSSKPAPTKLVVSGPSQADLDQLAAITNQYERNVGGMRIAAAEPVLSGSHAGAAVVETSARNWDAAPAETSKVVEQSKEEHEYGGEFYPVDRGVKKKPTE